MKYKRRQKWNSEKQMYEELCGLLGIYAAWIVSFLPTLHNNISVSSLKIKLES